MGKLTVNADAQPHSVVFTAARAAMVDRSVPRRYAGAMLNPYLPCHAQFSPTTDDEHLNGTAPT